MSSVVLWLSLVSVAGLMVTATDDFAAVERDRAAAAFVADAEAARLLDDFDGFGGWSELEAWLAVEPHRSVAELDWCVVLPDPADPGSRLTARLDFTVRGSARRALLAGDAADGSARRFVTAPAGQSWPSGWQLSPAVTARVCV